MKKLLLALFLVSSLSLTPALADVKQMDPDANLTWGVEETYGSEISIGGVSKRIKQTGNSEFWESVADLCESFKPGSEPIFGQSGNCDPKSYKNDYVMVGFSVLNAPTCGGITRNCLEEVFATGPDGVRVQGIFLGYTQPERFVEANSEIGNPRGESSGVWQLPGVLNSAGTDLYEVRLNMESALAEYNKGKQVRKVNLKDRTFNAAISPVRGQVTTTGFKVDRTCSNCNGLPADYSFGLSAVLPDSNMTWYSGRISDADVTYKKIDKDYYRITISGNPMEIPTFRGYVKRADAPESLLKQFHWCESDWNECYGEYTNGYGISKNWTSFLEAWRPLVKDSATGNATVWTIRTVQPVFPTFDQNGQIVDSTDGGFGGCVARGRAAGILSTNSLMYNGNIPEYVNGFFNYKVAGMHYQADGKTEFQGRYELVMDEALARCMFKFPKVPLSATVTVSGSKGETTVATTTVGTSNGKLRLAAYNFTFSEKNIKIKITAKGYITCFKGSLTKSVKGTKCPAGFKKA